MAHRNTAMAKLKRSKTLLRRVLLVATAVVLGLNIYKWNAQSLMGNRLPMPFGLGVSVVLSGSMEPTLSVNDLAIIRETDSVEVGDIVVYQSGNALIIHRVLEISGDRIVTKGDANNTADESITLSDIKGIMTATVPRAGALIQFVRKPAVMALMLIAAVMLTELSYRKDKKENQQELDELEEEIRRLMSEIKEDLR